jgi:hypothetical protein
MIIDYHNHLGGPDKNDGRAQSPDELIGRMDAAGVDMAVVFPFNEEGVGDNFERSNDYIAKAATAHPDRIIGFCRLDPNTGDSAVKELERSVKELGLRGLKLHPSAQNFTLDGPELFLLCAAIQDMKVPVVLDTGKKGSPPVLAGRLAAMFPEMTLIMAHMNVFGDTMAAAKQNPNVLVGTTGYFNLKRLLKGIKELGAERFVSGSDSPYIEMESELGKFNKIDITEYERGCITGSNIAGVLGV